MLGFVWAETVGLPASPLVVGCVCHRRQNLAISIKSATGVRITRTEGGILSTLE